MFRFCQLESVREVFDTGRRWFHLSLVNSSTNLKHPDSPRMLGYQCKYCMRHKARSSDNKTKNGGGLYAKKADFVDDIDFLKVRLISELPLMMASKNVDNSLMPMLYEFS